VAIFFQALTFLCLSGLIFSPPY